MPPLAARVFTLVVGPFGTHPVAVAPARTMSGNDTCSHSRWRLETGEGSASSARGKTLKGELRSGSRQEADGPRQRLCTDQLTEGHESTQRRTRRVAHVGDLNAIDFGDTCTIR